MLPEPPVSSNFKDWVRLLIVFVIAFDVAAFWQWMGGSYQSEFGGHRDEGMHYVAGLHVQDSIRSRMRAPNIGSDTTESIHRKTGEAKEPNFERQILFGDRLPGLPIVQSVWVSAFGASRLSVLLLVAALAAGVATMLYRAVREEFGDWAAIAAALLWLCAGPVRESYGMFMPEMLGAFAAFGGALAWGRFLDLGHRSALARFCIFATIAVWTDGAGVAHQSTPLQSTIAW